MTEVILKSTFKQLTNQQHSSAAAQESAVQTDNHIFIHITSFLGKSTWQPISGNMLKSFVSNFDCHWMNGKSCLLRLVPPPPPPRPEAPSHPAVCHSRLNPDRPRSHCCVQGRRGSPYPFLIDTTQSKWRWSSPPPPPSLRPLDLLF